MLNSEFRLIKSTAAGVEIDVRVIPRAGRTQIAGDRDGRLLVRLAAPPVDGAANDVLVTFLAGMLGVARRAISIVAGERSRQKRIAVEGIDLAAALERLLPPR
jgi:uncharacterized protein (TIGR00251 family)